MSKQAKTIQHFLRDHVSEIKRALPRHMSADRMARIAITECRKNPKLMECDPATLFGAFIQCAQVGLELGVLGHAYILPFRNNKTKTTDVQLIIGYKGMIDLARRSGEIVSFQAHAVYEKDSFEFEYGLDEKLKHVPYSGTDKGALVCVYAIAKLVGGGHQVEVMQKHEIDAIRQQSKSKESGPWATHYEEMAKKTVIRRLFKYLPVSVEIQRAVSLDEAGEANVPQQLDTWIDAEPLSIPGSSEKGIGPWVDGHADMAEKLSQTQEPVKITDQQNNLTHEQKSLQELMEKEAAEYQEADRKQKRTEVAKEYKKASGK